MINVPQVKLGIVSVSRDCFPIELSTLRRNDVANAYGAELYNCSVTVENELDVVKALGELAQKGVNALIIYLGNFGPETPETLLAQKFSGPKMFVAAAEERKNGLINNRGDAYCGLLNASYNLKLRGINAYIPESPVVTCSEMVKHIDDFKKIAGVLIGLKSLKIFSFGPRPNDFLACNAPIKCLYDLGVEIEENSELDLYKVFKEHDGDKRIPVFVKEMEDELKGGNLHPSVLYKLAQYELTLLDWYNKNIGCCKYGAFANKCWPAFQTEFGFVPCYVNGRLAAKGIPVACETDIYGALTEYIITVLTKQPPLLLDINNTVPEEMAKAQSKYKTGELFMGFHCGNGSACLVKEPKMKHQLIMKRSLEPDKEPDITRGTLEGDLKQGDVTLFRLQSTADSQLKAYVAQGEILDMPTNSFGTIGVIGVEEMPRFYRHVLIAKQFPHHAGVAQGKQGKYLFEALKMLGVKDVSFNRPKSYPYPDENPFID